MLFITCYLCLLMQFRDLRLDTNG
ncbi:protein of unknown function [Candidatus Methylomirabilis oxygeniifera]|uniref:Uncharacterized protein n=1 Tax=Methylomirabilis oxygeniifera TaxID=671143 RepID=D5MIL4_METO1|nr:protein of unknown function [Candidatus Methylomirabilis oxyfera]